MGSSWEMCLATLLREAKEQVCRLSYSVEIRL